MQIAGQIAVVTGAASGIGKAVVAALIQEGARCVPVDLNPAVVEMTTHPGVLATFVGDTCDDQFRQDVFATIKKKYGTPRICVPCAGITRDGLAVRIDKTTGKATLYSKDDFRKVLEVNLMAPIYWALETIGSIAESRASAKLGAWTPNEDVQGSVVFIGSVSSHGNKGQIAYASTKKGMVAAASTISKEAMFYGVRAAIVHPGYTNTPMVAGMNQDYLNAKILPSTQLKRLVQPEEIAAGVKFLISNSAASGELWVDAGFHPVP
jgi:NAD(P)-dependent dehydrogenase (short-subunit alcohol dehydrogenase family)